MRARLVTAVTVVLAVMAWPSGALAGAVTVSYGGGPWTSFTFTGSTGEANTVAISETGSQNNFDLKITDAYNISVSGVGAGHCTGSGTQEVHCNSVAPFPDDDAVTVNLGDNNDSLTYSAGAHLVANGDAGNDTLIGGAGPDPVARGSLVWK